VAITQIVTGAAGVGAGMAVVGALLIPFTAGLSSGLTTAGTALGTAAGLTKLGADLTKLGLDTTALADINGKMRMDHCTTKALSRAISTYMNSTKKLSEDCEKFSENKFKYIKNTGKIIGKTVTTAGAIKGFIEAKRTLVITSQFVPSTSTGGKMLTNTVTAPGLTLSIPFTSKGWTILKPQSIGAIGLQGGNGVVNVALGIVDIVKGANNLNKGSDLAKKIREYADTLASDKNTISEIIKNITTLAIYQEE